jgi:hypothetical protein
MNALSFGLSRSIRAKQAFVNSTGETFRRPARSDASVRDNALRSPAFDGSSDSRILLSADISLDIQELAALATVVSMNLRREGGLDMRENIQALD